MATGGPGKGPAADGPGLASSLSYTLAVQIHVADVVEIAEAAGRVIMAIYNSDPASWEAESKADGSPLTRADRDANALICGALARLSPHVPIVSEENAQAEYAARRGYQLAWCVDPLDGTKEFLARNGQFTVNIALLRGGAPVMGVVHTPTTRRTHWAAAGQGAYVRDGGPGGAVSRLRCATFSEADAGLTIVGSRAHANAATAEFVAGYTDARFVAMGSSLKMCLIAEGQAHIYPRLAPTCEWDTAAAHAVVVESGGAVLQAGECDASGDLQPGVTWREALARGEPVVYNKPRALNPFFVCYGDRRRCSS